MSWESMSPESMDLESMIPESTSLDASSIADTALESELAVRRHVEVKPGKLSTGRFVFATVEYTSGDWESAPALPENLIDSVARYTSIEVEPAGVNVRLDSDELFNYPFTWLTGHLPVRFTEAERRNLKRYIERGGFMMIDDHNHDITGIFHETVTEEIERLFGKLEEVPDEHELYRTFFTFPKGPPHTNHELNGWGDDLLHEHLYAIFTGPKRDRTRDRIGLLYSNKDYSSEWNFHARTKTMMQQDPTKFGVNLIVYALTR